MDEKVRAWRASGKYLPVILRDFHDQKDVFKTVHELTNVEGHEYCKDISFVTGQCYVIDIFLWFMARHGYTLQRSRMPLNFDDLATAIEQRRSRETEAFAKIFNDEARGK